jgi:hypothetical protein
MRHLHFHLLLSALMVPALAGVASPAQAGPPPVFIVSDQKASDRADELVTRGLVLGNKDRYAEAEPLMREAWGLKHSYDIAANLGIVEVNLKKWRDAAEHLKAALKTFPVNGKPEHKKLIEATLTTALGQVAALTIEVTPDKADVFVDGKSVGTAPVAEVVFVEPGVHRVEARLGGYEDGSATVQVGKGSAQAVRVALVQTPAPRVPPTPAPAAGFRPPMWLLATGGALAVVGLAAGGALTAVANGKASDAASLDTKLGSSVSVCTASTASTSANCSALHDAVAGKGTFSNAAAAGFVTGGVFALATVGLGVWVATSPNAAPVRVTPLVGAGMGGVMIGRAW